jgi:long-subunit fatty acid transport protein
MKKSFSILLVCATAQLAHAQSPIKAGTVALGGSINYSHSGEETSSNSNYGYGSYSSSYSNNALSVSPEASYFVADNLSVGVSLNYSIQETAFKSTPSSSGTTYRDATSFRVGPFVRYYKMLNDQFGFTGTLGGGYEHDTQPAQSSNASTFTLKSNGFYAALTPGIIFLPIPKLGIGASIGGLGYTRFDITQEGNNNNNNYTDTASTFGASFGLAQLTFSGTYFFGR